MRASWLVGKREMEREKARRRERVREARIHVEQTERVEGGIFN